MENEESYVHGKIIDAIEAARAYKGDERTAKARYTAIAITELEKALAVFVTFVVNDPQPPSYPRGGFRKA